MELLALGTPEMPVSGGRVPRQAATAAKAAIKKDLLEQNRRVGSAPLSMASPSAAAEELTANATPATAAKQSCVKQKKQAKVFSHTHLSCIQVTDGHYFSLPCLIAMNGMQNLANANPPMYCSKILSDTMSGAPCILVYNHGRVWTAHVEHVSHDSPG